MGGTRNGADFPTIDEGSNAGAMSRRDLLRRTAQLGVGVAAASLPVSAVRAGTPRKGGSFRIGMGHGSTSDTIDPAGLFNGHQWTLAYAIRNTLTQIEAGASLAPCLATEWAPSSDARQWIFTIRKGVEFHNGKSLTIDDVIASLNHHRGAETKSAVKPIAAEIESIAKDGADKIVISLHGPNADLPYMLASANFTICPGNGEGGIDWESGTGTGGYLLKEFDPGVQASLERFPNYWRDDRAHADQVQLLTIHDPAARMNAVRTGDVDVVDQVDVKILARLKEVSGIEVEPTQGPLHYLFSILSDVPPFDNNDVRLALKYAVDREQLLTKILRGYGSIGNDHPIGPSYRYHDASIEQHHYDIDRAKFHLGKAGMTSLAVELHAADAAFAGAVDAAVLFADMAAPAGIDIKVVREPNDGYWTNVWKNKPFYTNYWGGYTTENEMFVTGYMPDASWNDSNFRDERFVKILQEAKGELDPAKRQEMFSELQRIVSDTGGQIIPLFPNDVLARRDRLGHDELAGDRGLDGRHIIERWWVED